MVEAKELPYPMLADRFRAVSPRVLGATGLASGVIALSLVLLGASSWIPLGAALVTWIVSGWALFFPPSPRPRLVEALGSVLLLSATITAFAVLVKLYLVVLGPSWIL